jgi:hypothetical protein
MRVVGYGHGVRRWRVRLWIRGVAVAVWFGLLAQQFSTIHFVRLGEMDPAEEPLGWAFLALLACVLAVIAFRPYIEVKLDAVTLQGPLRRFSFDRMSVIDVALTSWGLRFTLADGTHRTSILCQATYSFGEPRWFDVAEAVTGRRPTLPAEDH